ncbi:WPE palindromic element domain-containing protein [Wolbachia endosymbiont (group A) of Anomoia purmunda]|uniref:WPE palindromic element domain-containing protein n=1 Tax=Wolbachia endosymbiont (group A) of Anomoia purmunda TaxID=2953978 RepID=UPI00223206FC|nr:WPE palindromic element domain-containing protein [Wolbachia endosymbiont (group A) of Anomoia purmunda]
MDPEDLISTKWLHNKGWIPASRAGMTPFLGPLSSLYDVIPVPSSVIRVADTGISFYFMMMS